VLRCSRNVLREAGLSINNNNNLMMDAARWRIGKRDAFMLQVTAQKWLEDWHESISRYFDRIEEGGQRR